MGSQAKILKVRGTPLSFICEIDASEISGPSESTVIDISFETKLYLPDSSVAKTL